MNTRKLGMMSIRMILSVGLMLAALLSADSSQATADTAPAPRLEPARLLSEPTLLRAGRRSAGSVRRQPEL